MPQIAIYPSANEPAFISIWNKAITELGFKAVDCPTEVDIVPVLQNNETAAIILNLFDEIHGSSFPASCFHVLKRWQVLLQAKRTGTPIVLALHNREPHENDAPWISKRWQRYLLKQPDALLYLSEKTRDMIIEKHGKRVYEKIDNKMFKVCLPNYIGYYPSGGKYSRSKLNIGNDDFTLLAIGGIRPYKNIELIIELAKYFQSRDKKIKFIVAGKPFTRDYGEKLKEKSIGIDNFILLDWFIDDNDLESLLSISDALISPLDIRNSLNSSQVLLAFSYMKPIITPSIATILEYPRDIRYSYSYDPNSQNSHIKNISKVILDAKKDFDAGILAVKGEKAYRCVQEQNSFHQVTNQFRALFSYLDIL